MTSRARYEPRSLLPPSARAYEVSPLLLKNEARRYAPAFREQAFTLSQEEMAQPETSQPVQSSSSPGRAETAGVEQEEQEEHQNALARLDTLEAPPEANFNRITRLAGRMFDVPIALVSVMDAEQQWCMSSYGLDQRESLPEISFCVYAIESEGVTVVEDATDDPRLADNPLVTGDENVRFYAGAPLLMSDGYVLGTLCLMDTEPRTFGEEQQTLLADLAATVMDELTLRREVAERKRDEEKLRIPEQTYRTLFEFANDAILIVAPDEETILAANARADELYGLPHEALIGQSLKAFSVHPEQDEARFRALLDEESSRVFETSHRTYGGEHLEVVVSASVVEYDGEEAILSINRDVTERKQAEAECRSAHREIEERKEREQTLRLLSSAVVHAEDAVVITEADSLNAPGPRIAYVNDAFCENTGYAREEVIGRSPRFLQGSRTDRDELDRIRAALERNEPVRAELLNYTKKDTPYWVELSIVPVADEQGDVTHYTCVQRNVTEHKQTQAWLHASEQQFHRVLDHAQDVVFQTDADGRWTLLSPSWQATLGYSVQESLGTSFMEYLHPEDREEHLATWAAAAQQDADQTLQTEVRYLTKSGSTRWMRVSARLLTDGGDITGTTGTLIDITDAKRVQAEHRARERAEELLEAKTNFLNNMSHELRTPLASIIGFADMLAEEGEGEQQEFAHLIANSGKRLQETLESVLDLVQLEGGAVELDLEPLSVTEEARQALSTFQPVAANKGLALEASLPEAGAADVRARLDRGALHRVLNNLISNALKFTDEGGVTLAVEAEEHQVHLRVQDTGVGISEDFQQRLFEDFAQEAPGRGSSHEGSGLGLAITKRLVELMDGTVTVDSTRGEGSTFTISFPRLAVPGGPGGGDGRPAAAPHGESAAAASSSTPKKDILKKDVLVVEDNENTRALANLMLRDYHRVESAATPEEALAMAQAQPFDVLLIDINLGAELDGVELLARLRALPAYEQVPAVAMTAYAMPGDRERLLQAGFDRYLPKPFRKERLLAICENPGAKDAPPQAEA